MCVTRQKTSKSDLLRTYETSDPTQADHHCTIWEAGSATAAAPLFFRPVTFKGSGEIWCDGGLKRNNPVHEAVAEVKREPTWREREIGCLLSIGTGVPRIGGVSSNLAKFLKGAVEMMTASEDVAIDFLHLSEGRALSSTNRYFRFNVPQGMQDLQLDECSRTEEMRALTDHYLQDLKVGNEVATCARSLLAPDDNCR